MACVGRGQEVKTGRCGAGLRRAPEVPVMQATDFWNRVDRAESRCLDWPFVGRILGEREMRASLVIVAEVTGQDAAQVSFPEDENMIQALAPDRADEALCEGILPRAVRGRENFTD